MTDIKIGGPYPTGRQRPEPFRFEDATGNVSPVFDRVTRIVHPEYPENGEVTFLPGEAKPQWVRDLQAEASKKKPTKPNKPVTET